MFENSTVKLVDLCTEVSYGYTASANEKKVGPKFLRITDIQGGEVEWGDVPFCEIDEKNLEKNRLTTGDIVVARTGNSTGENYLFDSDEEAVFASYLIKFRVDQELANPYFVWLQMRTNNWWNYVAGSKSGSAQAGANAKVLGQFEFFLPERHIQDKAAEIILGFNQKLVNNRQTNQTLEQMAQAIFKSWFVDFEPTRAKIIAKEQGANLATQELAAQAIICGAITLEQLAEVEQNLETTLQQAIDEKLNQHNQTNPTALNAQQLKTTAALFPNELVESELGEIPEGWEVRQLPDVIDFLEGPGIRNWQYTEDDDGIKFINIRCIKNGDLNLDTANKLTREEAFGKYAHFQLGVDDIVVSSSGTLGRYAFVRSEHLPLSLNTSVIRFKKIDGVSTLHYIAGYIDTHLQWELEMRASGSAQRNFGPMHLKQIEMLLPSLEILENHNELLDTLFRLRQSNLKENDLLVSCRDALLPKLLSGELAVSDNPAPAIKDEETLNV